MECVRPEGKNQGWMSSAQMDAARHHHGVTEGDKRPLLAMLSLGYSRCRLEVQGRNLGWVEAPGPTIVGEGVEDRREQDRAGGIQLLQDS